MKRIFRKFAKCKNGSVAILTAACAVALIGLAALVVDGGLLYYTKARLQSAVDAAALAAAKKLPDTTNAQLQALDLVAKNVPSTFGSVTQASDVTFGTYDSTTQAFTASSTGINAVKISAYRTGSHNNAVQLAFAEIFGETLSSISATSIGVYAPSNTCVLALDPSGSGAMNLGGSSLVTAVGCSVQVNSSAPSALVVSNNAGLTAKKINVVGGVSGTTNPTANTNVAAMADPLSYLVEPTASSCVTASGSVLNPGTYCGNTTFSGVTLNPGVYYIDNGSLSLKQSVTGSGVMIFIDGNSSFSVTSGADINLSAPTTGIYRGIAIYQSRQSTASDKIAGGGSINIDGTIYIPKGTLTLVGSTSTSSNIGSIVAFDLTAIGSSSFSIGATTGVKADVLSKSYLVQ
jgi:Flp pilus assembly protein TadG